jgi:hypothetical protein
LGYFEWKAAADVATSDTDYDFTTYTGSAMASGTLYWMAIAEDPVEGGGTNYIAVTHGDYTGLLANYESAAWHLYGSTREMHFQLYSS